MSVQGSVLGDRYRLDEIIGRGGMAEVWRARDVRLDRDVAVKRLRVDLATDPMFQARFRREAQSAAGLNHVNIVAVYDTGEADDPNTEIPVPFIVMELIEGHTLKDVLRDGRKILPERALEFVQGTLGALAYSHRAGIIHRDIKPANVMLTTDGVVKVMDFGIARAVSDTSATMTQTAAVIGTAQYLSPEQARGETVDNRSDIYSAGCLLYELLVGRPPFIGDSPVSVAYQHVRELPQAPSELDPEITKDMDAIVLKSLAKDPADRYQSAEEMHDDIARLLAGEKVTAVLQTPVPLPPEPWQTASQPAVPAEGDPAATGGAVAVVNPDEEEVEQKRRTLPIVVGVLVLALLATVGIGLWQVFKPIDEPVATNVPVPAVRGLTEEAARSIIINANLRVGTVDYVNQEEDPVDTVVSQNPAATTEVPEGTPVNLVVNLGPKTATVPTGLTGMTAEQAENALKAAGFTVKREDDTPAAEPTDATAGNVTKVNPAEGAQVPEGSEVTITIATGMSLVPNLNGKTAAEAEALARQSGFTITIESEESTQTPGQVFRQTPGDGIAADRTQPIVVVIAVAPTTPVTTPSTDPPSSPPESSPDPSTPESTAESSPPSSPPASSTDPSTTPGG
ncbi:Stk1 family PASTA domain-containing Ser/Thr kinase [Aestuariimicrobium sp. Y1814]|uniref:Stk1 family PASTA domain-containing Ser/Thr kinase n=1 Tax=Aestuariimicrobium sp. Y1814 TaxID=3418742 RepID=UPI003DA75EDF